MYGKKEYAHINALLNQKIEEKKHLIAVHRGTWHGNIIQNTIPAYRISLKMGADMVEADIRRTPGNEHFRLDACYDRVQAKINISGRHGYAFEAIREKTY